ncbi:MAG: tetratricopeptide repeat protein [Promethearchaeota archaeon]
MSGRIKKPSNIYCIRCGASLTLKSNYCTKCGAEVQGSTVLSLKNAIELYNKGEKAREVEKFEEAKNYYQESVKAFDEGQRSHLKAAALGRMGICLQRMNLLDEALNLHQQALRIARETAHFQEVCFELLQLCEVYKKKNEKISEAIKLARQSQAIAQNRGFDNYKVLSLLTLANLSARLSDSKEFGKAISYLNQAFSLAQKLRSYQLILKCMVVKGHLESRRKNIGLAETLYSNARKEALRLDETDYVIEVTMRLAELEIMKYKIDREGEAESLEKAQEYISFVSEYAREKNHIYALADIMIIEGSLHAAKMDFSAARRKTKDALNLAKENNLLTHATNAEKRLKLISSMENTIGVGSGEIEVDEVLDYMGEALTMIESIKTKEALSSPF